MKFFFIFFFMSISLSANAITFNSSGNTMTFNAFGTSCNISAPPICVTDKYVAPIGDGFAGVGNEESRNNYRGMYWTGETLKICSGEVYLIVSGDISGITYKVSVWSVDITDNLSLVTQIGYVNIAGTSIVSGWNAFTFPSEILMTTGATVILISRIDPEVESSTNFISVRNGYDESDSDSRQWNIHYYSTGVMAGRAPGDEDQPEYFTCDWKLFAYEPIVATNTEYPNIPEDIITSIASPTSILIDWNERGVNNVQINHYNIYYYNMATAEVTLIDTVLSPTTQYINTGLTSGTYTYRVSAVSTSGKEGYLSLKNGTNWQTVLP